MSREQGAIWGRASPGRSPSQHLIVIGVVQIFIIIIGCLVLLHLVPDCPLPGGRMAVIHGVVGIASGADIRAGGEAGGPAVTKTGQRLSTVQPQHFTAGTDPRQRHRDPRGAQGTGSSPQTHPRGGEGVPLRVWGLWGSRLCPHPVPSWDQLKEAARYRGNRGGDNRGFPAPPAAGPGAPRQPQASPGPEAAQARP